MEVLIYQKKKGVWDLPEKVNTVKVRNFIKSCKDAKNIVVIKFILLSLIALTSNSS